mgnify:CR=1 FL=1
MIIINFSYKTQDFEEYQKLNGNNSLTTIYDFTASISKEIFGSTFYPSDFDNTNELHITAIADYKREMGLLSRIKVVNDVKRSIRSIKFDELPLYWLTSVSEKHPQNCVLKNVYYFKFLAPKLNLEKEDISIILPDNGLHFQDSLKEFISKKNVASIQFNKPFINSYTFSIYLRYLKNFHVKINSIRKVIPQISKTNQTSQQFVFNYYPQTLKSEEVEDIVLVDI